MKTVVVFFELPGQAAASFFHEAFFRLRIADGHSFRPTTFSDFIHAHAKGILWLSRI
jgi:hypothetical protein